jgi:hypothetical protein
MNLELLNQYATELVSATGLDPFMFFVATTIISTLVVLADLNTGVSVKIPGRGQLGLAGTLFAVGAVLMILATEGYQFFFIEIAKTTISLLIVSVFIAFILGRNS